MSDTEFKEIVANLLSEQALSDNYYLTPREIVSELDKFIIGQQAAKKAVAIALRNRSRRKQLPDDLRDEVAPKNIIMIGPTGVGKTEIARRLSKLAKAPFIKVEATKYTEVGYVGRDVESMVRDLASLAINMVKKEFKEKIKEKASQRVEERLLDILLPSTSQIRSPAENILEPQDDDNERRIKAQENRKKMRERLANGSLDNNNIEFETRVSQSLPMMQIFTNAGMEEMDNVLQNAIGDLFPKSSKKRRMSIKEAKKILIEEEMEKLLDMEQISTEAIKRTEEMGIIFIDEIDKIAGRDSKSGPDVSREGVQRDILPIVEGSTVNTKFGPIKTDHILFIASGAFHVSKPSDLIPELQGRFPIRVELESLSEKDFIEILTLPQNSLLKQYSALLATEGVQIEFKPDALGAVAKIAFQINEETENIGARRLHTIMEKLLEDISFEAPDLKEENKLIIIDNNYVQEKLKPIMKDQDLKKYIL
jgi:ATP-dependent HslUV protease ATP-binding subunit HslU